MPANPTSTIPAVLPILPVVGGLAWIIGGSLVASLAEAGLHGLHEIQFRAQAVPSTGSKE